MNILNTIRLKCKPCGKDTDHFISAATNQRVCSECWHTTPAQPEDFVTIRKPESVVMHGGGPERA